MIVVDTSVWIDYFNGRDTPHVIRLDSLLGREELAIGDIILSEVLQGFRSEREYQEAKHLLRSLHVCEMLGINNAILSADHYRMLRRQGISIRKTIDVIIASYCLRYDHALLFADRDFEPFVSLLGMRQVLV